ncbi:ATP-binding protein [Streptosporangium sp. DT93]|uniref:ATP-binding protein n=1 Tax=Streptosporangium sp. DT93 TaxID=3393428 RepID=UPI003CF2A3D5
MNAEALPGVGLLGRVELPGVAESVGAARRYVRCVLEGSGGRDTCDAELVVSELVANAVRHSASGRPGGTVAIAVADRGDTVWIAVTDEGSPTGPPLVPAEPDEDAEGGRGLWLVHRVALSWGCHEDEAGRVVWCRLARG